MNKLYNNKFIIINGIADLLLFIDTYKCRFIQLYDNKLNLID